MIKWPKQSNALAGCKVWATYDKDGNLLTSGLDTGDGRVTEILHQAIPVSAFYKRSTDEEDKELSGDPKG